MVGKGFLVAEVKSDQTNVKFPQGAHPQGAGNAEPGHMHYLYLNQWKRWKFGEALSSDDDSIQSLLTSGHKPPSRDISMEAK